MLKCAFIALCLQIAHAQAQGCQFIDKFKIATAMNIALDLVPYLSLEIPTCRNVHLADGSVGFVLLEDSPQLNNGVRSEIAINYPFQEGDLVEYQWSMMLPGRDAPGGATRDWWLVAQWHDQPDPRLGETWQMLKPQPPPVAVVVERRGGVLGIGLNGPGGVRVNWTPVPTDVWLDIRMMIRWSRAADGSAHLSVSGRSEIDLQYLGRTMLNGYQHYFKAGQYRAPHIRRSSIVYLKNVRFRKQ